MSARSHRQNKWALTEADENQRVWNDGLFQRARARVRRLRDGRAVALRADITRRRLVLRKLRTLANVLTATQATVPDRHIGASSRLSHVLGNPPSIAACFRAKRCFSPPMKL